jgi:tRNA A37 N6-isopentenylltransferase MiaA
MKTEIEDLADSIRAWNAQQDAIAEMRAIRQTAAVIVGGFILLFIVVFTL